MSKNIKIRTLADFLIKINEYSPKDNHKLYYRGHSDKSWDLTPGIYRETHYIENEDKIYREVISKTPYSFEGKSTIDSLSLMQHYGVPTRLLDMTTNPLVALYFTCWLEPDKDGELIILNVPNGKICHYNSDRATAVANIAKCDKSFNYEYLKNKNIRNQIKSTNEKYFGHLLHNIREDKSYYHSIINPNDINSVFAVEPKMDNPRITRQYGAFLLFGVQPSDKIKGKKPMATLKDSAITNEEIPIKKKYKKTLMDELDRLGINKSTLFPEIDRVAEYIKENKSKKISKRKRYGSIYIDEINRYKRQIIRYKKQHKKYRYQISRLKKQYRKSINP